MFPGGWPGAGLLVLRLAAAIPLIIGGGVAVRDAPQLGLHAIYFATIEVWIFFSRGDGANWHLLLAALGVSLVMLGPGAWSVDARLFGRKRIDIRGR